MRLADFPSAPNSCCNLFSINIVLPSWLDAIIRHAMTPPSLSRKNKFQRHFTLTAHAAPSSDHIAGHSQ